MANRTEGKYFKRLVFISEEVQFKIYATKIVLKIPQHETKQLHNLMLADSAASNGEPIRYLAESSAKPMRSRGFKNQNARLIQPIQNYLSTGCLLRKRLSLNQIHRVR